MSLPRSLKIHVTSLIKQKEIEVKVTMQSLLFRCPFKPYAAAETTVAETLMALLYIF